MIINKITPKGSNVDWLSVRVRITSYTGTMLITDVPLAPDSSAYDETTPVMVEPWYVVAHPGQTTIGAGDSIKVTGLSSLYEGAVVQFYSDGELIASSTLPTDFP
jgi:hypothetical protein